MGISKTTMRMCPMLTNCWDMEEAEIVYNILRTQSKTQKELKLIVRKLRKTIKINKS